MPVIDYQAHVEETQALADSYLRGKRRALQTGLMGGALLALFLVGCAKWVQDYYVEVERVRIVEARKTELAKVIAEARVVQSRRGSLDVHLYTMPRFDIPMELIARPAVDELLEKAVVRP